MPFEPLPRVQDPTLPRMDGVEVHRVPGFQATKAYVCPSCANPIEAGLGHVVVWPEGEVDERRHWHLHCWRLAVRRGRLA